MVSRILKTCCLPTSFSSRAGFTWLLLLSALLSITIFKLLIRQVHVSQTVRQLSQQDPFYTSPKNISHILSTALHIAGIIWPRETTETKDRIENQLNLMVCMNQSGKMSTSRRKLIYIANHSNYGVAPSSSDLHVCPVQACDLTIRAERARQAHALVFYRFNHQLLTELTPRPKNQIWIATGGESPSLNARMKILDAEVLGNRINWTMHYRKESTISTPHGRFQTFENFTDLKDYPLPSEINYASGKKKKVAWMVSNCKFEVNSGRGNYAKELAKYIDVDIVGRCGNIQCPKDEMEKCLHTIRKDYKFYLAFENNCCREYITEKFFRNALHNDVVPVVLGAAPEDYKAIAPPGSYIHVDDFESPKDLAEYLHLLDRNDTLYNEYFRWKRTGKFLDSSRMSRWCRLCALLHANDDANYVHWYPDFKNWFEKGICLEKASEGHWQSWRKAPIPRL